MTLGVFNSASRRVFSFFLSFLLAQHAAHTGLGRRLFHAKVMSCHYAMSDSVRASGLAEDKSLTNSPLYYGTENDPQTQRS